MSAFRKFFSRIRSAAKATVLAIAAALSVGAGCSIIVGAGAMVYGPALVLAALVPAIFQGVIGLVVGFLLILVVTRLVNGFYKITQGPAALVTLGFAFVGYLIGAFI